METKLKIVKPLLGIILTFFFAFNSYANIKSYVKSTANESEEKISTLYPFIYFDLKTELFYDALSRSQLKEKRNFLYTQSDLNLDLNFNKTF
jgi:hypothetical protein